MPSVDVNRLKGNFAQALASTWLSRMCLVRPVAEGTDIGIDLYCESIVDGVPYLHFWVQVKAIPISSVRVEGEERTARYSFDRRHLEYWDRQPIPVYALLVPVDSWPPSEPDAIFLVRVTEELVKGDLPATNSITYHTKDGFERDSLDDELRKFVTDIVPWDTSALLMRRGIVAPLPGKPRSFPFGVGFQYLPQVLSSIMDASVQGLLHVILGERREAKLQERGLTHLPFLPPGVKDHSSSWEPLRKHFERIAATFGDNMHYYGLSVLAWSARDVGDFESAKAYLHLALARIAADSDIQDQERSTRLAEVQELLEVFEEAQKELLTGTRHEVSDSLQEQP